MLQIIMRFCALPILLTSFAFSANGGEQTTAGDEFEVLLASIRNRRVTAEEVVSVEEQCLKQIQRFPDDESAGEIHAAYADMYYQSTNHLSDKIIEHSIEALKHKMKEPLHSKVLLQIAHEEEKKASPLERLHGEEQMRAFSAKDFLRRSYQGMKPEDKLKVVTAYANVLKAVFDKLEVDKPQRLGRWDPYEIVGDENSPESKAIVARYAAQGAAREYAKVQNELLGYRDHSVLSLEPFCGIDGNTTAVKPILSEVLKNEQNVAKVEALIKQRIEAQREGK